MQLTLGVLALLIALGTGAWQAYFKYIFNAAGRLGQDIQALNTDTCVVLGELTACEKIVLHQQTGLVFAACSSPASRAHWLPAVRHLNASGRSTEDWVGIFDPSTRNVRKLALVGFNESRGINTHGMDVVPSATSSSELFVYMVNQRPPLGKTAAERVDFTDPSIEIFRMDAITGHGLKHLATVSHSLIQSPNDVVGSADGKSFWVTNDGSHQRGFAHFVKSWLKSTKTSVIHCTVDQGCMTAVAQLPGANGLTRAPGTDTFYVANPLLPMISVVARQADNTLVITDIVTTELPQDNLSVDADGTVWAAALPLASDPQRRHFVDPRIPSPSIAFRVDLNPKRSAFFGEKYRILKTLEDDGNLISGATTAVYDSKRGRLFMSSITAPAVMCDLPRERLDSVSEPSVE